MNYKQAKNIIFDMDGTLLDSMGDWRNLGAQYVKKNGKLPEKNLDQRLSSMTMEESARYFIDTLKLKKTVSQVNAELLDLMVENYETKIQGKPYMLSFLREYKKKGAKICLLTTSTEEMAKKAFSRLGILSSFYEIYSEESLGVKEGKRSGAIYQITCEKMGARPEETVVFEDALYAIRSAKEAGCYVVGVYDWNSQSDQEEIRKLSDKYISKEEIENYENS